MRMSLTYHLWWYGDGASTLCLYNTRISLGAAVVHMPGEVLSVMGPDFARYAKAVCSFWTWVKVEVVGSEKETRRSILNENSINEE